MPVHLPCAYCGAPCKRRPSQISEGYKAFCDKSHESAYKQTPEGRAWMLSWCKKPNIRIPHYRKKEGIVETVQDIINAFED